MAVRVLPAVVVVVVLGELFLGRAVVEGALGGGRGRSGLARLDPDGGGGVDGLNDNIPHGVALVGHGDGAGQGGQERRDAESGGGLHGAFWVVVGAVEQKKGLVVVVRRRKKVIWSEVGCRRDWVELASNSIDDGFYNAIVGSETGV